MRRQSLSFASAGALAALFLASSAAYAAPATPSKAPTPAARTRSPKPVNPDAAYLAECCNYAWTAYGRAVAAARKAKRRAPSPAKFFGGPPPKTKLDTLKMIGGGRHG